MFNEYFLHLSTVRWFELFLVCSILYNFFKILFQTNFYLSLAYLFLYTLFLGILIIFWECDLVTIILWIIYFGVFIIFFLYSLMWIENIKTFKFLKIKKKFFVFLSLLCCFFCINNNIFANPLNLYSSWVHLDYFSLLQADLTEELEFLGFHLIITSTSLLFFCSYFLLIACCVVVLFNTTIKFFQFSVGYKNTLKKSVLFQKFFIFKNQCFFIQNSEETFQKTSLYKNYKISHKLHRVKTFKRRI